MSMRHYGVETTGFVITRNELQDLIIKNFKTINKDYLGCDNVDELDIYSVDEFYGYVDWTNIYYDITGKLWNYDDWGEKEYFDGETIIITELEKNNLFEKYNNMNEIKQELKQRYEKVGIVLDDEFIDKHFGRFEGAYYG